MSPLSPVFPRQYASTLWRLCGARTVCLSAHTAYNNNTLDSVRTGNVCSSLNQEIWVTHCQRRKIKLKVASSETDAYVNATIGPGKVRPPFNSLAPHFSCNDSMTCYISPSYTAEDHQNSNVTSEGSATTISRNYRSERNSTPFKRLSAFSMPVQTPLQIQRRGICYSSNTNFLSVSSSSSIITASNASFSSSANSSSTSGALLSNRSAGMNVFDRHTKLRQRERAAVRADAPVYDYLKDEVGYRLSDRIFDIKQEFEVGLDLGCGRGHLSKNITDASLKKLYMGEYSPGLLSSAVSPDSPGLSVEKLTVDEEQKLPFANGHLDVVLSNLSLHWVNNLPGCLREVHRCLKADGALLGSMFGGDTLYQLRSCLLLAEMERQGGMAPHVSPFTEVQDIGGLLTNAGFSMLTVDTEDITVGYPSMYELLWDLQGMAESNASATRKLHLPRDTLMAAAALYQEMYGTDDGIPATFQIIYMIGWKANPDKAVSPAARGSGEVSLKDLGRLEELMQQRGMEGKVQFIEELVNKTKPGKPDGKE